MSPETNWRQVWKNLHTAWVPEETKSNWYVVVHDIIPTNEPLHAIRLAESDRCTRCERRYTLTHRLTECNEGTAVWQWTKDESRGYLGWTHATFQPTGVSDPNFNSGLHSDIGQYCGY